MTIFKVTKKTQQLVARLNKKYLGLDLHGITFYEYEGEDFPVAWSNPSEKAILINPHALPSNPAYAAFILAHEVAHIRLMHKGKRKRPEDEFAASFCAQFLLANKVGSKMAKALADRWANDWLKLTKTQKKSSKKKAKISKTAPTLVPAEVPAPPAAPAQAEEPVAQAPAQSGPEPASTQGMRAASAGMHKSAAPVREHKLQEPYGLSPYQ